MFKTFGCLIFLVFLSGQALAVEVPAEVMEKLGGSYPASMIFLGAVNGKSFFVDNSKTMTWAAALEFCESSRMELASVTSKSKVDFLRGAYNAEYFTGWYWTSGRDALDWRQFVWHYSGAQPDTSFLPEIVMHSKTYSCVQIAPTSSSNLLIHMDPCESSGFPLCEI